MATAEALAAAARGVVAVPSTLSVAAFYVVGAAVYPLWRPVKLPGSAQWRSPPGHPKAGIAPPLAVGSLGRLQRVVGRRAEVRRITGMGYGCPEVHEILPL
jgi:hypothetical protein